MLLRRVLDVDCALRRPYLVQLDGLLNPAHGLEFSHLYPPLDRGAEPLVKVGHSQTPTVTENRSTVQC